MPRDRRSISPPGPKHLWTGPGTWLAGGMAALHAAFGKLVTDFTDHLTEEAIVELEIAGLTVGEREATGLRDAIRALLTEKLLEALRNQKTDRENTGRDVISRLRVTHEAGNADTVIGQSGTVIAFAQALQEARC
jgi:hypothetical protein